MKIYSFIGKKTALLFSLLILLAAGCSAPVQLATPADLRIIRPGATALVVVHSRSGNTALAGKAISEMMSSDYLRLQTPKSGGDSIISSPNRNKDVEINPRKIDLKNYTLLFLGSPIWYWHANAYIYTFIKSNDLTGKKIVLFYTYEGGLSKGAVTEWTELVQKQGGTVVDVIGINRKIFKTDDALQGEVRSLVGNKKNLWLGSGK